MKLSIEQKKEIRIALAALLRRGNIDTFVVITEEITNKFVQFAVNDDTLLFDLPTSQLSYNQLAKAKEILSEYQISFKVEKAYAADDKTTEVGSFGVFSQKIGNDLDLAIELVEKIILQVFEAQNIIRLHFDEN